MIKKKGKFLTFIFSLMPGAGHMYMGFFKMGISFMSVFLIICFLAAWLDIGPILIIAPLLWFYSFFDAINKMSLTDEEFYTLEDRYLFSFDSLTNGKANEFIKKNNFYVGVALIVLGSFWVLKSLMYFFNYSDFLYNSVIGQFILHIMRSLPELFVAGIIIFIGVRLIMGKKREGGDR